MTRKRKLTTKYRNISSYFSHAAMKIPPVKKTRIDPIPLTLPPSAATPSLLTPSPSPHSPPSSSHFPLPDSCTDISTFSKPPPPPPSRPTPLGSAAASPSSPLLPPTPTSAPPSPSPLDELENVLILRHIYFQKEAGSADQVQLFTRSQTCLTDSLIDQIHHAGLTRDRLGRLLDYLVVAVGPTRMPSADIMSKIWHMTTDTEVVVRCLNSELVMKVSCLFHTLLSLHPPGRSHTALQQYRWFIRGLGGGSEVGMFSAWLHIKQLLSAPGYKYFHYSLSFLVDLLLSDFWSHTTSSRAGDPLFVSIFWSGPSNTTSDNPVSLPVRQLLESIHHTLDNYAGSEIEFSVLQSQLALFYLVTTRCSDVTLHLSQLAMKLSNSKYLLLLSLLHPQTLHASLVAQRLAARDTTRICCSLDSSSTNPITPHTTSSSNSKLPDIKQLNITKHPSSTTSTLHTGPEETAHNHSTMSYRTPEGHNHSSVSYRTPVSSMALSSGAVTSQTSTKHPSFALTNSPFAGKDLNVVNHPSDTAPVFAKVCTATSQAMAEAKLSAIPPLNKHKTSTNQVLPTARAPGLHPKPLILSKPLVGVKRRVNWTTPIAKTKKMKISNHGKLCENCDAGAVVCHRCNI